MTTAATKGEVALGITPTDSSLLRFVDKHQLDLSLSLLALILTGYQLGSPLAAKFVTLGHRVPGSEPPMYAKGADDVYFVIFWAIAFTFVRAAAMEFIFRPLGRTWGVTQASKVQRLCEQGWNSLYYIVSWSFGTYVAYHSDYWMDTSHFWIGYPHLYYSAIFKFYYLSQIGFWMQQIFVLHVEKRRRDYIEMFFHHILTNTLLIASYYTNFVRIGNAILCTMDFADIFLSVAKVLRYVGLQALCDFTFVLFVVAWVITRHGMFTIITYSVIVEPERHRPIEWDPANGVYFSHEIRYVFMSLLLLLQCLLVIWMYYIIRVVYRVVSGSAAHDNRSDSDMTSPEDEGTAKSKKNA
ncbi:Sphingosine N-acyltransferase lag1 [Tieghemiomyces parasiticus]|uniref:Sphingosine N-acyltransferase lag1 n=1 Tax=Tieghemiomyces parasiticus TaxID=78921 RepID=A0A9W8AI11_9FUNG|nr:Sphingosine N-acyltransferase lag1 [Tieghemiomyces parasiticus]